MRQAGHKPGRVRPARMPGERGPMSCGNELTVEGVLMALATIAGALLLGRLIAYIWTERT